jgi:N-acetylgalactosamine-N,N'-diacetylbacillosaminyl-diphospho-undecaprenol 4-alpha-N-acetylgalactosaminyltransferase
MRKIAFFIYSLGSGGAERVVSTLLWDLKDSYDITLILMSEIIFYDIPPSIKIVYLERSVPPEKGFFKLIKIPILSYRLRKIVNENGIELIFSFLNRPNYINILSNIPYRNHKVIISERTNPSAMYRENTISNFISKLLIKTLYNFADIIVPNSHGTAYELVENFGIKEELVEVVHNPVDMERIDKLKYIDISMPCPSSDFIFVNIARMEKQKNHKLLIEAFARADMENTTLLLIGDGYLRESLHLLCKRLSLEDRVYFLGKIDNPYPYLNTSDSFVLSSDFEGFPNVLIEALACHIPIISTNCPSGPAEILKDDYDGSEPIEEVEITDYGILVEKGSVESLARAMKILRYNETLQKKLKSSAKSRVLEYEKGKILKKFDLLIKKV